MADLLAERWQPPSAQEIRDAFGGTLDARKEFNSPPRGGTAEEGSSSAPPDRTLSIGDVSVALRLLKLPVDHVQVQEILSSLEADGISTMNLKRFEQIVAQASEIRARVDSRRVKMQTMLSTPAVAEGVIAQHRALLDKLFIENASDRAGAERAVSPQTLIRVLTKLKLVPSKMDEDAVRRLLAELNLHFLVLSEWDEVMAHLATLAYEAAEGELASQLSSMLSHMVRFDGDIYANAYPPPPPPRPAGEDAAEAEAAVRTYLNDGGARATRKGGGEGSGGGGGSGRASPSNTSTQKVGARPSSSSGGGGGSVQQQRQ